MSAPNEKEFAMNLKNKVALIATSVLTVGTLVAASPALAHKSAPKPSAKTIAKTVVSPTATPTPTVSPTVVPTPPVFRDGDRGKHKGHHDKGRHIEKPKGSPITKTVTVDVPETGSYQLLVTEVKPADAPAAPAGKPERREHSFTVAVTGTGSQTITLNLPHPGDYKVSLISVVSTQSITATAPTN
ncbi:MAG: hypothetical protein RJA78_709 [Actinomycetota bacterium]|jgi:hypothetical protein